MAYPEEYTRAQKALQDAAEEIVNEGGDLRAFVRYSLAHSAAFDRLMFGAAGESGTIDTLRSIASIYEGEEQSRAEIGATKGSC